MYGTLWTSLLPSFLEHLEILFCSSHVMHIPHLPYLQFPVQFTKTFCCTCRCLQRLSAALTSVCKEFALYLPVFTKSFCCYLQVFTKTFCCTKGAYRNFLLYLRMFTEAFIATKAFSQTEDLQQASPVNLSHKPRSLQPTLIIIVCLCFYVTCTSSQLVWTKIKKQLLVLIFSSWNALAPSTQSSWNYTQESQMSNTWFSELKQLGQHICCVSLKICAMYSCSVSNAHSVNVIPRCSC